MNPAWRAAGLGEDWPLAAFTALAVAGGGLVLSPLAALAGGVAPSLTAPLLLGGALALAAGLSVSLAHLGRPLRAARAVRQAGSSRLSAEALLALAALAAAVPALVLRSPAAAFAAAALAAAFLVSLGLVYALPGQYAWRGAVRGTPLSMGASLALLSLAAVAGDAGTWRAAAVIALSADLVLFLFRVRRLATMPPWCAPAHPARFARRATLLLLRAALVDAVPLLLVLAGVPLAAAVVLAAGILVDRVQFYALAVRWTTESEIDHAEESIPS